MVAAGCRVRSQLGESLLRIGQATRRNLRFVWEFFAEVVKRIYALNCDYFDGYKYEFQTAGS